MAQSFCECGKEISPGWEKAFFNLSRCKRHIDEKPFIMTTKLLQACHEHETEAPFVYIDSYGEELTLQWETKIFVTISIDYDEDNNNYYIYTVPSGQTEEWVYNAVTENIINEVLTRILSICKEST